MGKWPNGIGTCTRNKQSLPGSLTRTKLKFFSRITEDRFLTSFSQRYEKTVPAHHLSPVTGNTDVLTSFPVRLRDPAPEAVNQW